MKKETVIYNSDIYEYMLNNDDAIIQYLNDYGIDPLPNAKEDAAIQLIDDDYLLLTQLINNFDKKVKYQKIYVDATLGLWRGTVKTNATFKTLFNAIFKCLEDVNKVYFKKQNSALTIEASHHDGTNIFKFYKVVGGKKYAINQKDLLN